MATALAFPNLAFPELDGRFIQQEANRRRWRQDPAAWARERGKSFLWSKQIQILESIRDNRKTAVPACHGPGKSFTAGIAVGWWLDIHRPGEAGVVTTAPTFKQVRLVLWKEIRALHSRARLSGRVNQVEWLMQVPAPGGGAGEERVVGVGLKPSDYDPGSFQGIHFPKMLVVVDESGAIKGATEDHPHSIWESAESLLSNDDCRELAIGNPDDPQAHFERICRPGSGFNVIRIDAFSTPNFTGELVPKRVAEQLVGRTYVEECRRSWAPSWKWSETTGRIEPPKGVKLEDGHPLLLSKVFAIFPKAGTQMSLISIPMLEQAQERELAPDEHVIELGVDVGAGGDASTSGLRMGPWFRIVSADHNPDTMQTAGKVKAEILQFKVTRAKVDSVGIGKGVHDRLAEQEQPSESVNVGEKADDPEQYFNRRSELWWGVRERFEAGDIDIDPEDEALAAELTAIRYKRNSRGQIQVEEKAETRKRLGRSPDRADALMLSFAPPRAPEKKPQGGVLW